MFLNSQCRVLFFREMNRQKVTKSVLRLLLTPLKKKLVCCSVKKESRITYCSRFVCSLDSKSGSIKGSGAGSPVSPCSPHSPASPMEMQPPYQRKTSFHAVQSAVSNALQSLVATGTFAHLCLLLCFRSRKLRCCIAIRENANCWLTTGTSARGSGFDETRYR